MSNTSSKIKLHQHLEETKGQQDRLQEIISKYGGTPTSSKAHLSTPKPPSTELMKNTIKDTVKSVTGDTGNPLSIINISSSYDSIPKSEADAYTFSMSGVDPFTSSRAEVKALTKTVAFQLAQKGIRVNAIAPGLIASI
jgi:NAD(P)-dependent dehydrogenase (short-subunit alcohol dehydrogenase family)